MQGYLQSILKAREERAWMQTFCLEALGAGGGVVQFALNIPGCPKSLPGDAVALSFAEGALAGRLPRPPAMRVFSRTAAGCALLHAHSAVDLYAVKRAAVEVEESEAWCRVLDIDVIDVSGPVGRAALGLPSRRCLLCGDDAKICARSGAHSLAEVRAAVAALLVRFV